MCGGFLCLSLIGFRLASSTSFRLTEETEEIFSMENAMGGLMFDCVNWGDIDCHSDVSVLKHPKKLKNGEDISLWPVGEELAKIDEFCRQCEARFFEVEERKCPVCGGTGFIEVKGFVILDEKDKKKFENYYLKCTKCETPMVLLKPH